MTPNQAIHVTALHLHERRSQRGWTHKELAHQAGVSLGTVQRYETGRAEMKVKVLARLFDALGCELVIEAKPREARDE